MAKNNKPFDPNFSGLNPWNPPPVRGGSTVGSSQAPTSLNPVSKALNPNYYYYDLNPDYYYGPPPYPLSSQPTVRVDRNEQNRTHRVTMEISDHLMGQMTRDFLEEAIRGLCHRTVQSMAPQLEQQLLTLMVQIATPTILHAVQHITADPSWIQKVMKDCVSQVMKETVLAVRQQMQKEVTHETQD